jgi:DNA-directed RNA polymerase subunit RPC12/RpoP
MTAKMRTHVIIAIVIFLMAMAIWGGLGYYFYDQANDPQYEFDKPNRDLFITIAGAFFVFAVIAMIFMMLSLVLVLAALKGDRYDAAYNRSLLVGGLGVFFGMGAGVMLILGAKKYLKNHPKYLATLPVPTPICERCGQPVQFDKDVGGWYCPTCKIHLTKGVPKPKAPEKPVFPQVQPKPMQQPPMYQQGPPPQGYAPQPGMAAPPPKPMGPPPQGYPPQGYAPQPGMAAPPPKPMGPPPQMPPANMRNITCGKCGKTFQWTIMDPNQRMVKCPWCNNEIGL